jgi:hypothetical protein
VVVVSSGARAAAYAPRLVEYTLKRTRLFTSRVSAAEARVAEIRAAAKSGTDVTTLKAEHNRLLTMAATEATMVIPLRETLAICDICHKAPSAVDCPGTLCAPCRRLANAHYCSVCDIPNCVVCAWVKAYQ